MICRCPKCNGALEYNPVIDEMECAFCGNTYDVQELAATQENISTAPAIMQDNTVTEQEQTQEGVNEDDEKVSYPTENMECKVYTCTSCAAELLVNDVEVSTYCAYCGQPTIVFSRVSKELKPQYIIPFEITREQAVGAIRATFSEGRFVPDEIKNFEVERVRGIYIPYWVFNIYYYDYQKLRGTQGSGNNKVERKFLREAECNFENVTLDASRQLSDESSQRLEPYNLRYKKPFDIGYMSGFYADRYDMTKKEIASLAIGRVKKLFDKEMDKSVAASRVRIMESYPKYKIKKAEYILLPAWFMTFRYKNEPYTILVNGQTGKIIGAVPYDKKKVFTLFSLIAILVSMICTFIFSLAYFVEEPQFRSFFSIGFMVVITAAIIFYSIGASAFSSVKKNIELTKAKLMHRYVKDRQDK